MTKPKVVAICGSTRFADQHLIERWKLESTGEHVCLTINVLPAWYLERVLGVEPGPHMGERLNVKGVLDELHLRKIDLADEVLVVNVEGYIGDSTRAEIEYAHRTGKPVRYTHTTDGRKLP